MNMLKTISPIDNSIYVEREYSSSNEIEKALHFSLDILKLFDFKTFKLFISTQPEEKSVGDLQQYRVRKK